ncbi:hypothetical protein NDI76_01765 [Halogeometricum sp. S1BR25-6]|uniref:Uncharacterized protein n=1 Tax=Halogeometricum salsisoli TaxID=2950536 RepID=A0ABU2G9I5_9EURY|nr:hypothetical protein [Halogeometricum sp. S1BR25-6]MDS0297468.1 hypothetical protein [Halogeometricum sp. S1BR25-6]
MTAALRRPIRVRLPDGSLHVGPVVDLRRVEAAPDAATLRRAVAGGLPAEPAAPSVVRPPPTPVHPFVSHLAAGIGLDRRGALAALARLRGHDADGALAELDRVRKAIADAAPAETADLAAARRRAAEAGVETDRLRERAATIRGRVEATRDTGGDVAAAETDLAETMRRLSEVATERVAARQRLAALEAEVRRSRDTREARMRLEDRAANLERDARRALAAAAYDAFAAAVTALPPTFDADAGTGPGEFDGDPLSAALAVARAASLRAPVVVDPTVVDRFGGLAPSVRYLSGPVVVR